jgi:hypothetical protein
MDSQESRQDQVSRVAREVGSVIRRQARRKWENVRTAERNEGRKHVWRFQSGPDRTDRFLYLSHDAMTDGENPAPALLEQLKSGRLFSRLDQGPETALMLSRDGRLEAVQA